MSKIRLYGSTSGYVDLAAPAVADDATLTLPIAATGFGKVIQVVSTTKTDTFSASVASGAISGDVTNLTVTITPQSATSKLFVTGSVALAASAVAETIGLLLYRDGSNSDYAGAADGNRTPGVGGLVSPSTRAPLPLTLSFMDTSDATTATTYSVRILNGIGTTQTMYVNRGNDDSNSSRNIRAASTLIVMEVAA